MARRTSTAPGSPIGILARALLVLIAAGTVQAASDPAQLSVSATVVAYAKLQSTETKGSLTVTRQDAEQGWVRVPSAVTAHVRTNSRHGYRMRFRLDGDFITGAQVETSRGSGRVSREAPSLRLASNGPTRELLQLDVRLELADGIEPGIYFWPLTVESVSTR